MAEQQQTNPEAVEALGGCPVGAGVESPSLAWSLSAEQTQRPRRPESWDLWMTWMSDVYELHKGAEMLLFDGTGERVKEWRVYGRIPKSRLWFVGTRLLTGEKAPDEGRPTAAQPVSEIRQNENDSQEEA